ncbi:SRPBCC family protein [Chitinivorax sp. B]|uniref:SRPBCC family protein n=1 Tax=Chitinivorax sp. B TaxID=2502235 RepID=UPI0010F9FCB9|nr:SRPBCC family protein [Chitinivorax sp. B]
MALLKTMLLMLIGMIVLLLLGSMLIPSQYHVQRSLEINAPAERVFSLLNAPKEWKHWTVWNQRDPAMLITYTGPESGVGAKWAWISRTEGNGEMTFTQSEPSKLVAYELVFPDFGSSSKGQLKLERTGTGTKVIWTNDGDVGSNPLMRYLVLVMDSLIGPDFEQGLTNLKKRAESAT